MRISLLALVMLGLGSQLSARTETQPNIIFILVDDLGYSDVGFNGSTYYETPNLDRMAKQSLILDRSYMYSTCSPSRAAVFTGKQSFRTGVYTVPVLEQGNYQENVFSRWTVGREHPFYSEFLEKAGYKSIHLGKWHVVGPYPDEELNADWPIKEKLTQPDPGDFSWVEKHRTPEIQQYYPEGRGFLKNVGGTYRGDPALEVGGYQSESGGYRAPFSNPFLPEKENGEEWLTDRLTADAIDFMEEHKEGPFFVNLHYYAVHRPVRARSEELYQKYLAKQGDERTGQGFGSKAKKEKTAAYATMIESLDDNFQRLVDFLDENNLSENTLIIFTSDNGYHELMSADRTLRGAKGHIYEGGIKVPCFIHWPGKVTPRRSLAPVSLLDYFPTFLELAGIQYDGIHDGRSLTPLFQSDIESFETRSLYWHIASNYHTGACSAIHKGDYKLIQYLLDGKVELYDLANDPLESKNLVEEDKIIADGLLAELVQWRKKNAAPLPPASILEF